MQNIIDIYLEGTLTGHQNPIFAVSQTSNSNLLFTAGNDKGVVIWDLEKMAFQKLLCKVGSSVYVLKALPNSDLLAVGMRSGQLLIVDTINQTLVANLKTEQGAIFAIDFIEGKQEMIAIGEEGFAYVWDLNSFELLYRFKIADTTVRTIAISKDQQTLVFGDKKGRIQLFDASDYQKRLEKQIHSMPITSLLFINNHLISGGRDAQLYKLKANDLEIIQQVTPHMFTVYGIDQGSGEESFATVSRDKTLKIWNEEDFSLIKNVSRDRGYDSHHLSINGMLWNQDRIFTVSDDKTVKVWKLNSLEPQG
ncbi:WD40 repeat domain-containing protein [Sphingobacterium sp. DK4209]|uniref:WD40 repeat domain-containing protein n=1 Tax=Sphingobacterium zhuxiongii TaxID=2662364 RepID=A0A5Q0Q7T8_9SPHI|nr:MULTISPECIES: WD40 repeat domain-containing protein [unclassified Sphingobacterium]MVZ64843.1 WD40 repeat domain-containing protein [Sphingobacterium sp. DK4209]QGA25189.1 WD40 repeat domain-containing protein [Sphingobacterium sp. dk4302]